MIKLELGYSPLHSALHIDPPPVNFRIEVSSFKSGRNAFLNFVSLLLIAFLESCTVSNSIAKSFASIAFVIYRDPKLSLLIGISIVLGFYPSRVPPLINLELK